MAENIWNAGDKVVVAVPQADETFDTFAGKILAIKNGWLAEVLPSEANAGTLHCRLEWLHPEGWTA